MLINADNHNYRLCAKWRCGGICYFLVSAQESNQRKRHREGAELIASAIKAALPYIPIPARIAIAAEHLNDRGSAAKMFRFLLRWGRAQRDGRAKVGTLSRHIAKNCRPAGLGGVVHRRGRHLLVLFLPKQEKNTLQYFDKL